MHRRRHALPWVVSAAVMAVFIPTLAWGSAESGPAPAAEFVTGDNDFRDARAPGDPNATSVTVPAGSSDGGHGRRDGADVHAEGDDARDRHGKV